MGGITDDVWTKLQHDYVLEPIPLYYPAELRFVMTAAAPLHTRVQQQIQFVIVPYASELLGLQLAGGEPNMLLDSNDTNNPWVVEYMQRKANVEKLLHPESGQGEESDTSDNPERRP